jgi:hypothetical protein
VRDRSGKPAARRHERRPDLERIARPIGTRPCYFVEKKNTYDPTVSTYIVKRQNSYGYTSTCTYDLSFGQMIESKDINGQKITYQLDNVGRVVQITGPYEQQGNGYTLKFEYHPEALLF